MHPQKIHNNIIKRVLRRKVNNNAARLKVINIQLEKTEHKDWQKGKEGCTMRPI